LPADPVRSAGKVQAHNPYAVGLQPGAELHHLARSDDPVGAADYQRAALPRFAEHLIDKLACIDRQLSTLEDLEDRTESECLER
jgi:hypothetical protein